MKNLPVGKGLKPISDLGEGPTVRKRDRKEAGHCNFCVRPTRTVWEISARGLQIRVCPKCLANIKEQSQ